LDKRKFSNELRRADLDHIKKVEDLFIKTIKEDNLKVAEIWNNSTIDESAHQIIGQISDYKEENQE